MGLIGVPRSLSNLDFALKLIFQLTAFILVCKRFIVDEAVVKSPLDHFSAITVKKGIKIEKYLLNRRVHIRDISTP